MAQRIGEAGRGARLWRGLEGWEFEEERRWVETKPVCALSVRHGAKGFQGWEAWSK